MFNETTKQIHLNLIKNLDPLLKKHNVHLLGCWFDLPGHTLYEVYDAPDANAFQKLAMEPEILQWSSFNTMEIKQVATYDDVLHILGLTR